MTDPLTTQLLALSSELQESLGRLNALVDNRGAWIDAIEGCRESIALLSHAHAELKTITEHANELETQLALHRAELTQWNKSFAESIAIETSLRGDIARHATDLATARADMKALSERNETLAAVEKELRTECEQHRKARDHYDSALVVAGNLRTELKAAQESFEAKLRAETDNHEVEISNMKAEMQAARQAFESSSRSAASNHASTVEGITAQLNAANKSLKTKSDLLMETQSLLAVSVSENSDLHARVRGLEEALRQKSVAIGRVRAVVQQLSEAVS